MNASSTRATLLSRVRDPANEGAWREFVARYGDLVLRYGLSRGLQYSDAEDVRQVVLLYLSRALREFRYTAARGRFRDYLGVTARNAVNRLLACPRAARGALSMEGIADPAGANQGDALWEQEWVDHHYRRALEAIRPACEGRTLEVFERLLAGDGTEEVAVAFGMSIEAVKKVRQRVRERLREQVARQVADEEGPDA